MPNFEQTEDHLIERYHYKPSVEENTTSEKMEKTAQESTEKTTNSNLRSRWKRRSDAAKPSAKEGNAKRPGVVESSDFEEKRETVPFVPTNSAREAKPREQARLQSETESSNSEEQRPVRRKHDDRKGRSQDNRPHHRGSERSREEGPHQTMQDRNTERFQVSKKTNKPGILEAFWNKLLGLFGIKRKTAHRSHSHRGPRQFYRNPRRRNPEGTRNSRPDRRRSGEGSRNASSR